MEVIWIVAVIIFVIVIWDDKSKSQDHYDVMCKCGNFDRCPYCNRWRIL